MISLCTLISLVRVVDSGAAVVKTNKHRRHTRDLSTTVVNSMIGSMTILRALVMALRAIHTVRPDALKERFKDALKAMCMDIPVEALKEMCMDKPNDALKHTINETLYAGPTLLQGIKR